MRRNINYKISILILFFTAEILFAQANLSFVRVSPKTKISQDVGFTNIKIEYSRPAVNGREIWGKLVPFGLAPNPFGNGKPMPWRMGANESTIIELSNNTMINGKQLNAGTYSMHAIVNKDLWTVIFNSDVQSWGSFFYDENKDVLRIEVKPVQSEFKEWLTYEFENFTLNSVDLVMQWADLTIPIKFEFDGQAIALEKFRNELTNLQGFNPAAWSAASRYCLQNKINLDEAVVWIDKAISMNGGNNFENKSIKAGLLSETGMKKESDELMKSSMENASENDLNVYGYQLMNQGRMDDAIDIFKLNIKRHPDAWNVYDSLGEALNTKGDKKGAKENYNTALKKAPQEQHQRIKTILENL